MNLSKIRINRNNALSSITTLVTIYLIIFLFAFSIISFKNKSEEIRNTNQVIVYLKDIDDQTKLNVTKKILELPGVSSLTYESKKVALKYATVELGVEIPEEENPLNDALFIFLNKNVDINELKNSLLNISEIGAIDLRTKAIQSSVDIANASEKIIINFIVLFSIIGFVMMYNTISFSVKARRKEIYDYLQAGVSSLDIKKAIYRQVSIVISLSLLISFVIYRILKYIIKDDLSVILQGSVNVYIGTELKIFAQFLLVSLVTGLIVCFLLLKNEFEQESLEKELQENEADEYDEE